jgi:hypothetical protein
MEGRRVAAVPLPVAELCFPEALLRLCVVGVAFFLLLEPVVVGGFWATLCALAIAGGIAIPKAITMIHFEPSHFIRRSTQLNSMSLKPIVLPHTSHPGNH